MLRNNLKSRGNMRAVAVSVWIFINLVFVGMCGYIYLLWSQYWQYVERQHEHMAGLISSGTRMGNGGSSQIFYYNHESSSISSTSDVENVDADIFLKNGRSNNLPKHRAYNKTSSSAVNVITRRNSQPRFPKIRSSSFDIQGDASEGEWRKEDGGNKLMSRVAAYKSQLVVQLRRVLLEESSVFKSRGEGNNPYGVQYRGPRGSYVGHSVKDLVCSLKSRVNIGTLTSTDEPFAMLGLSSLFPEEPMFSDHYNTCAIVTNAGSLYGSNLGSFIGFCFVIILHN